MTVMPKRRAVSSWIEDFVLGRLFVERRPQGSAVVPRVEQPGQRQQLLARLLLELTPEG